MNIQTHEIVSPLWLAYIPFGISFLQHYLTVLLNNYLSDKDSGNGHRDENSCNEPTKSAHNSVKLRNQ